MIYALVSLYWLCSGIAPAAPRAQQRADFLNAEQALKRGNNTEFEHLMNRLADYPLYPYLRYQSLRNRTPQLAAVASFLTAYPDTPYAVFLRKKLLKHLASHKRWSEFVNYYRPGDSTALDCRYYQALHSLGRRREAMTGARELWLVGHSQPQACNALFSLWHADSGLSHELAWQRFGLAMAARNPGLAKYLRRYLSSADLPAADVWLSVHRKPERVLQCSLLRPSDPHHGSIFAHGAGMLARSDPLAAQAIWQARKSHFVIDAAARAGAERHIGLALAKGRYRQAPHFLAAVAAEHSTEAVRAWRIRSALLAHDWAAARSALDRLTDTEQAMPRWRYWRAKTLERLGRRQQAEQVFKQLAEDRSLYGFLAADRLGLKYTTALTDRPPLIDADTMRRIEHSRAVQAAFEFRQFDRESAARREWWHTLKQLDRNGVLAAAKIAQKWQWHQVAIFTIAKAEYWDDLTLRFPLLFRYPVVSNAKRLGLDPAVAFGLIRRESVFNPAARSPAGARGLMQIMPATGRHIAGKLNEKWRSANRLYDPDLNVRYGTFYFNALLKRFNDNFALAAAGYNAGPGRVKRWLPVDQAMPADIWIESIPFDETRKYVTTVLTYMVVYQQRLRTPVSRLSDWIPPIVLLNSKKNRPSNTYVRYACPE